MGDAKQCPWCERWCLKDDACNYIFACGLDKKGFHKDQGCGRSWCWQCGKKFCGQYYDPLTGEKLATAKDHHNEHCCKEIEDPCPGGHNSHCSPR